MKHVFSFTAGQTSRPHVVGDLTVCVDRLGNDSNLLTVSAGIPVPQEVQGLPVTLCRADTDAVLAQYYTDRRGQVWLAHLEPIVYRLRIELPEVPW
jgi:hypothetical protein